MTERAQAKGADKELLIGASWYPEMWPEEEWEKDVLRMKELRFTLVRLFEFAWHRFEPREGVFDFGWAQRLLDLLHRHGIKVMVGTPSAAPPAWLTTRYPEVLVTHPGGKRGVHGMRKHYSVSSMKYRELCRNIVTRMAESFKDHPALHSWQLDNEIGEWDYGEESVKAFRRWLMDRYGSIAELNRLWGLEFWSQAYDDFAQIPMPTASVGSIEVPERHHPSLLFAVARYQNDAWASFLRGQCTAIRRFSDKPISTNMTPGFATDWFHLNKPLDRVGQSLYRDVEHYHWAVSIFDRMRAEKPESYWLLETAPSWSAGGKIWNIHHDAKGITAFTWLSALLGGSLVLYWQWREHWAGQEMQHGTLVTATGRWRPNKEAIARLGAQFAEQGSWLLENPPLPARIGLILSFEAAWAFSIDPIDENMAYPNRLRDDWHLPLLGRHLWRDVISEEADFSTYKLLILPLAPILKPATRDRLKEWVKNGGKLFLGPLTGYRSTEFTAYTDREFGGLEDLIGGGSSLRFSVHWVESQVQVVLVDGTSFQTRAFCDAFEGDSFEVLAHYRGGYGDGRAAMVRNRYGKGEVVTLGCMPSEEVYLKLVSDLAEGSGVRPLAHGSPSVCVVPRSADGTSITGYGLVNMTERPQRIVLPVGGKDLLADGEEAGPEIEMGPLEVRLLRLG